MPFALRTTGHCWTCNGRTGCSLCTGRRCSLALWSLRLNQTRMKESYIASLYFECVLRLAPDCNCQRLSAREGRHRSQDCTKRVHCKTLLHSLSPASYRVWTLYLNGILAAEVLPLFLAPFYSHPRLLLYLLLFSSCCSSLLVFENGI